MRDCTVLQTAAQLAKSKMVQSKELLFSNSQLIRFHMRCVFVTCQVSSQCFKHNFLVKS